jgi:hypothetical protein
MHSGSEGAHRMSDERFIPKRFEKQHDDASSGRDGLHGRAVPLSLTLRPYRVIKRYRGDCVWKDADVLEWADLWALRTGDVSWPDDRRG